MSLTKNECATLRMVITRLLIGPAWFDELPHSPELRALIYELRRQSDAENLDLANRLQELLPTGERLTASGIQAVRLAQPWRQRAKEAAAHATPAPSQDQTGEPAPNLALLPVPVEVPQCKAPEPAPAPAAPGQSHIPVPVQQCKAEAVGLHCEYPNCDCSP